MTLRDINLLVRLTTLRNRLTLRSPSVRVAAGTIVLVVASLISVTIWHSKPSNSVAGTVVDPVGAGIPGATVALSDQKEQVKREVMTDMDGSFKFDGVGAGGFVLSISRSSSEDIEKRQIEVTKNGSYFVGRVVLHFDFHAPNGGRMSENWKWTDSAGKDRSTEELKQILEKHYRWLESGAPEDKNTKELEEELVKTEPNPWRTSHSRELVGASLREALLGGAVLSRLNLGKADLSSALLDSANLSGSWLVGSNLTNADLLGADLSHVTMNEDTKVMDARLVEALLIRAEMRQVHMEKAALVLSDLRDAIMQDAHLDSAELSGADMTGADLSGAVLRNVKFGRTRTVSTLVSGAQLIDVNLEGAKLEGTTWNEANVAGAIFEPASLPDADEFAKARGLELLTYQESPWGLVQIRNQFRDRGFDEQERKITYAIRHRKAELLWIDCTKTDDGGWAERRYDTILRSCGEYFLNRIFFDWPCQYGMSPGRTLQILVAIWALCAVLNYLFIRFSERSSLFVVPSHKPRANEADEGGEIKGVHLREIQRIVYRKREEGPRSLLGHIQRQIRRRSSVSAVRAFVRGIRRWLHVKGRLARVAMFFSLISAFNIGYREFNLGRWLPSLTKREYNIKAVGWVRVVAGWQALISTYLVTMWFLTYFGHPFE